MVRTTVTIRYTDLPDVELGFPLEFTKCPEIVPLGIRHVLSTTRPQLAPEVEALWRSCVTARNQGARLRALRPGDRVTVQAVEGEFTWELTDRGFHLQGKRDMGC